MRKNFRAFHRGIYGFYVATRDFYQGASIKIRIFYEDLVKKWHHKIFEDLGTPKNLLPLITVFQGDIPENKKLLSQSSKVTKFCRSWLGITKVWQMWKREADIISKKVIAGYT